jgi:hypothetical protein
MRPGHVRPALAPWLTALALVLAARPADAAAAADSIRYAARITDVNQVGFALTNHGFFGDNFNSRTASFEFPLGTGYEHMSRGGLWVGALALSDTGSFIGVSAAIVDNSQGSDVVNETEFTPAGTAFTEVSRITNSPVYSDQAVSDQDLTCLYSDEPARGPRGY